MTGRDFTFQIGTPFSAAKARIVSHDMPVAIRHVRALIVIGIIRCARSRGDSVLRGMPPSYTALASRSAQTQKSPTAARAVVRLSRQSVSTAMSC